MNVGSKVEILRKDIHLLKHRKIRTGVVTNIDGANILVRPSWCNWEIELYPNEIALIN